MKANLKKPIVPKKVVNKKINSKETLEAILETKIMPLISEHFKKSWHDAVGIKSSKKIKTPKKIIDEALF